MATFTNTTKNSAAASNVTKNASTMSNVSKSTVGGSTIPVGHPLGPWLWLTYAEEVQLGDGGSAITWSNLTKNN
jgi:hypothetical protein